MSTATMVMATKLEVIFQDPMTNYNYYISTFTIPVSTKLGRFGIYNDEFYFINSYKSLIMWSCKVK